jgi:retron-type reverse transcriptase
MGCQEAISYFSKLIYESLDKGKRCLGIFLDIAKAFNSIEHNLLLKKLKTVLGNSTLWLWFKSYLSNRSQTTRINGETSDPCKVIYGIPQGTVLGPLLFNIYVNDLLNIDINSNILAFADDTVLFFEGKTWSEVESKANAGLVRVNNWYAKNSLMLNKKKSVFIPFALSSYNKPEQINIKLHNNNCKISNNTDICNPNCRYLSRVATAKYLGVIYDEHLKWKP